MPATRMFTSVLVLARLSAADLTGEDILRQALESEGRQEKLRRQYLWHEHHENGPARADGSLVKVKISRDFEVIFLEGFPYIANWLRSMESL